MKRPITPGQRRVLDFLRSFYEDNDQLPPIPAIAQHFGWASWNAAQTHLVALAKRGYLERNAVGRWKFTDLARAINRIVA
jgi:SOS-response transcriptional repressor LexA